MTDEEIKNKAKEASGGNYYYEQGFIYGFELGEENGRKEGYEQGILKDCLKVSCPNCTPSVDNYCMNCEYANFIIDKDNQIYNLEKENKELKAKLNEYVNIVEDDEVKCVKLQKKIKGLEEQIESLTKENNVLIKGLGCETCSILGEYLKLNNTIRELEEQVEKMKCCGNCKYNEIYNGEEFCNSPNKICKHYSKQFENDDWELVND